MQLSTLFCLSLSHRTAPVELREIITHPPIGWDEGLRKALPQGVEWYVLSTCNRFEIYVADPTGTSVTWAGLTQMLERMMGDHCKRMLPYFQRYGDLDAAEHLCRVAASLESLVLGEAQIQGQVTNAFLHAIEAKSVGPTLSAVVRTAIRTGKRARSQTRISANAVSVSSVAANLAASLLGDLHSARVVVLGVGEMGLLTLKALHARGVPSVTLINRTHARAVELVESTYPEWETRPLSELDDALATADVVFSATSATEPVVTRDMLAADADLLLFDMAVPRDVCPGVAELSGTQLIDIDHLETAVDRALAARRGEVPKVLDIICEEMESLAHELRGLTTRPLVVELRCKAERIRQAELKRSLHHIGDVDPDVRIHMQRMSKALVNKLLHEPTVCIKALAYREAAEDFVPFVQTMFDLEQGQLAGSGD